MNDSSSAIVSKGNEYFYLLNDNAVEELQATACILILFHTMLLIARNLLLCNSVLAALGVNLPRGKVNASMHSAKYGGSREFLAGNEGSRLCRCDCSGCSIYGRSQNLTMTFIYQKAGPGIVGISGLCCSCSHIERTTNISTIHVIHLADLLSTVMSNR